MNFYKQIKRDIKYTGLITLMLLFTICYMVVDGLRINNMSLSDYRDTGNETSTVIFSEK